LFIFHEDLNTVEHITLVAGIETLDQVLEVYGGVFSGDREFVLTELGVDAEKLLCKGVLLLH
jgi:hypothetical protein